MTNSVWQRHGNLTKELTLMLRPEHSNWLLSEKGIPGKHSCVRKHSSKEDRAVLFMMLSEGVGKLKQGKRPRPECKELGMSG